MACGLLLSGCGPKAVEPIKPPPSRLTCKAEPPVPAESTDRAVANYIVSLVEAGADCRSQLRWIKDFYGNP